MDQSRKYNNYYGIFFVIHIIVINFFLLNVFGGIMFEKYDESWNKESNLGIKDNPDIERYWDYLNRILTKNPEFEIMFSYPNINFFKRFMRKIIYNKIFEYFIITIIILNLIVMSISYDGSSEIYNTIWIS